MPDSAGNLTLEEGRAVVRESALLAVGGSYSDAKTDRAIWMALSKALWETRADQAVFGVPIGSGDRTFDPTATEPGFIAKRLLGAWIDDRRLTWKAFDWIANRYDEGGTSGQPEVMAALTDSEIHLWPRADDDYTLKVKWFKPLVGWTWGTPDPDQVTLNVPGDLAGQALWFGASAILAHADPDELHQVPSWVRFQNILREYRSAFAADFGVWDSDPEDLV